MLSVHTCPLAALGGKESGGMNVYVRDLSRELGRRGLFVDVFTRSQNPDVPQVGDLGPNARVIHLKAGPEAPYDKNLVHAHTAEFTANLKEFARKENIGYDLVHSHYWLSGLVARQLQSEWKTPVMQMFHTLGELKNQVARTNEQQETPLRLESEREIMSFADRLIAANPLEKAQMIWLYGADPTKIEVIPCGVDLELFHPIPRDEAKACLEMPQDHRMMLFVGRVEPLKGIDVLIEAMALVLKDKDVLQDEVCLCIIGGDPDADADSLDREMSRLQRVREKLGIADVVTFHGKRDQDTLPYHYSAADVCVVPSHYESFGMVALEAMACGTPVIASKVGGLTFTVRDGQTGFLVPSDDQRALADKLSLLLTDGNLRRTMGQQAVQLSKRYSWSIVAEQVVAAYRDLAGHTRPQVCCRGSPQLSTTKTCCCD
ncbi:MAG: glycosyl transferase family 1 [Chloroflexi bacterium B3_Chlor]|nr:MAG: glycosyl transferase family 1 [Chloroflexi bacterium B3_Chlor]